jgi:redox-sensitive bicupin YhaK (pirin superfamily)
MDTRPISRIDAPAPAAPGFIGQGHTAVEVVQPTALASSDPFVLLMDDRLDLGKRRQIGGAHPHAGLETVTLVLEGTLHDRDEGELSAGDVLWMSAGRGIIHNEAVEAGGRSRVLQLWIALSARDRNLAPRFEILRRDEVQVVRTTGAEAVLYRAAPVTLIDLSLEADATFRQDLPSSYNGFFYVLDGSVRVDSTTIAAGQVGWLAPTSPSSAPTEVVFSALEDGARLVLYAGQPVHEPLMQHGPFVAGSPAEILEFNRRFRAGDFTRMSELAKGRASEERAPISTG